ncbi:MAG: hypothetical protein M0004_17550 [Actinomycetota bacterium]|nr:hypothetical protein [Actinomycetota bacterium]
MSDAATVRRRNQEPLITDAPFAEIKEHIAGYDVLEHAELDEAIEVASKHLVAAIGDLSCGPCGPSPTDARATALGGPARATCAKRSRRLVARTR